MLGFSAILFFSKSQTRCFPTFVSEDRRGGVGKQQVGMEVQGEKSQHVI